MQSNLWGGIGPTPTRCKVVLENGMLVFTSPYDPALVNDLKAAIPNTDRKWDGARKAWLVTPQHGKTLAKLADQYYREMIDVPAAAKVVQTLSMRLLEVHYLGQCKDRGDGNLSAFAYLVGGDWGAVFPETVLRGWFEAGESDTPLQSARPTTLYGLLGIPRLAGPDDIKTAFRRMARATHPDICKDADAAEMFIKVKNAFDILSDPGKRARYNAGLLLEAQIKKQDKYSPPPDVNGYRSPLRCGYILTEGIDVLGRFNVSKILDWADITRGDKTLVSSWPMGAKVPLEVYT
jgi:hypothetical protein